MTEGAILLPVKQTEPATHSDDSAPPGPERVVLRVVSGRVVAANEAGERWVARAGSSACHLVVKAKTLDGAPICTQNCAIHLEEADGPVETRSDSAVVKKKLAKLDCQRVGDEVVVVMDLGPSDVPSDFQRLTVREKEILGLVQRGYTTRIIAQRLGISMSTVRTHVEHVRERLGARSRAEAVARAVLSGQLSAALRED